MACPPSSGSLPSTYTASFRSYASFNSPSSNVSALSGPYDEPDPDYMASGANNTSYMNNPNDEDQYDPMAYSTGNEPTFGLLEDDFASSGDYLNAQPRLQITEPQFQSAQGQYGSSQYYAHRATPEHSPSPASSAGEIEQQNYTGVGNGQAGGQGVGASHQPSPMMGNNLPPLGFSEGLANLNFGGGHPSGAQSPPEGYTSFQQQLSRVPTPISVQSSDASSPQHPSASASSPGTPGSASGRPVIITSSLDSLSSPPAQSSSSDTQQYDAYLNVQQRQQQQQQGSTGDAPNILLIPSSPAGLLPSQQDSSAQPQHSVNAANNDLSAQRPLPPPGLHDFLGESTRAGASGSVNPSQMFGHRPRSHSSSDIVRMTQQGMQINNVGYGNSLAPNVLPPMYFNNQTLNNGGIGLAPAQQQTRLGSWQDPTLYSYPHGQRTINPNEAFGQQQQLELENLVTLPQSPDHGTQSLPSTASYHQPGMHTYQSAPVLSITNHSSSTMLPSLSNPQQYPSPSTSLSSNSTAGQGYFAPQQVQSASLEPGSWNTGGVGLKRNKTHTGTMHRRGAQSEDIRSLSPNWNSSLYGGDRENFLRSITSADGSLAPPSGSSSSASPSPAPNADSLGLGLGGYAASDASSNTIYDDELNGGVGAARGRRRTSSAASDRSPYSRPASISPSRSPVPYLPATAGDYFPSGPVGAGNGESTVPVSAVERQHVTTPATELASQSRRKNKAPFVCPVEGCGSTFTRQFNLKGHLRSHREERPYVCKWPKCGKGFARQHDCKRHEALHLNIRPFTCDGCGKTFARMDALNRHREWFSSRTVCH